MKKMLRNLLEAVLRRRGERIQFIFLSVLLLLLPIWASGQAGKITGKLTDENGVTLPGVSILVKGTTVGTVSDASGNYAVNADKGAVLVFSYVGFETREITLGDESQINVILPVSAVTLREMVVTGYTTEKKRDLLGAVSVVDVPAMKDVSYPNVLQAMSGRVAGVNVDLSGVPGQGAKVKIRGIKTLGNNEPLYIVDGVPLQSFQSVGTASGMAERPVQPVQLDLSWLNPSDIESVQVLKDGASASIYGSRASNGVVIITTKQAKEGKATITFNARYGVDQVNYRAWVPNSQESATLNWRSAVNQAIDPNTASQYYTYNWHYDPSLGTGFQGLGEPVLDKINYVDKLDPSQNLLISGSPNSKYGGDINKGTDWQKVAYQTGITQNYDLQFSQGSKNGGVRLSANYFDQKGALLGNAFKRYSLRLSSNYKFFNGRLNVGENIAISVGNRKWGLATGLGPPSILPPYTEDGQISGPPAGFDRTDNPLGVVDNDKWNKNRDIKTFGNVFAEVGIIKDLNFRSSLGIDYDNVYVRDIYPTFSRGIARNTIGTLAETQLNNINLTFTNTLNYSKTINKSVFNVLAGTEYIKNEIHSFYGYGQDFALNTDKYYELDAATGQKSSGGNTSDYVLFSYFAKANYTFDDKYLLSATIRRDGSSRFGAENRFANFPAVSGGWRIGSEKFMSGVSHWLSNLKIRGAWGKTGNQSIANNARFALYQAVYSPPSVYTPWGQGCTQVFCANAPTAYDITNQNGGTLPSGFLSTQTGNQALKWEQTTEVNVGLDFGLLDDRITGTLENFKKTTTGILIQANQPGTFGDGNKIWTNGASMETKGFEVTLGYRSVTTGKWSYSIGVVAAHVTDKITYLPEDLYASFPGNVEQNIVGHSPRALFGFVTNGILKTQEEVNAAPQYPGIRVGQFNYQDLNGDGKIDASDQKYQGVNGTPKLDYGINGNVKFMSFELGLQFAGMAGRRVSNYFWQGGNQKEQLIAWTTMNTNSYVPALGFGSGVSTQGGGNSFLFRNGSFFSLRQISLGYRLTPEKFARLKGVTGMRVYFNLDNVFYLYKKSGPDSFPAEPWLLTQQGATPGAGADQSGRGQGNFETRYPKPLTSSIGVNISF